MNQKPSWKFPVCWLDFTLPEGVMQAAHEKGHPNLYIDHAKDVRIINILQFSNYKYELKARKDDKINILSQKKPKKTKMKHI